MLEYQNGGKVMTTDEYRYKLQEHGKLINDNAEDEKHPLVVGYRSLIALSYSILQELIDTQYFRELEADDTQAEISQLNGYIEFYQDMLKKTNDALCNMINLVKEKEDATVQAE